MRWLIIGIALLAVVLPAQAATLHSKGGAQAHVGPRYAVRFQNLIDDLEAHGARIHFMGGSRPGWCGQSNKHSCGNALDICQLRRGSVDRRCHLPARAELNAIAARHGLFSGGLWCSSDYGHVEGGRSWPCGARHAVEYQPERHRAVPHPIMMGAM